MATVDWIGYAPFYIAVEKNMFEKYGVKVALKDFEDPALIPAALQSGGIQGAMYTYDQVINLVANGNAYRVEMTYRPGDGPIGALPKPGNVVLSVPDPGVAVLFSPDGQTWQRLPTQQLVGPTTLGASSS